METNDSEPPPPVDNAMLCVGDRVVVLDLVSTRRVSPDLVGRRGEIERCERDLNTPLFLVSFSYASVVVKVFLTESEIRKISAIELLAEQA